MLNLPPILLSAFSHLALYDNIFDITPDNVYTKINKPISD